RRGGVGLGLGIAAIFYVLNLIANLTEQASFLKYLTPFGYAEGSDIIANNTLNPSYLTIGIFLAATGIFAAFFRYSKKDIV
ncbi:MAG: ABC transporter permease, partial [Lachnospiraceae bacterium]|nr:ABC transporter permease [Lachnospiraceae bacterium]